MFTTRDSYIEKLGYGAKIQELEKDGKLKFHSKLPFKRYHKSEGQEMGRFEPVDASVFIYQAI